MPFFDSGAPAPRPGPGWWGARLISGARHARSGWSGRYEGFGPAAPTAGLAGRGLGGRPRFRPGRVRGGGAVDRALWTGLPPAPAGGWFGGRRTLAELAAAAPAPREPAPGRDRGADLSLPRLLVAGLGGGPVRRAAATGKLRCPSDRGHQLRPQDQAQPLLQPLDQPGGPLPGRRL